MVIAAVVMLLNLALNMQMPYASQGDDPLKLAASIPAANARKYTEIRDAKDWRNPYLIVLRDGVNVRSNGFRAIVPVSELRRVLVRLPRTAWPYGRVVALQEISLRAVGGVDDAPINANVEEIVAVLKALDVKVSYWPMA